jgi:hypothetical protein
MQRIGFEVDGDDLLLLQSPDKQGYGGIIDQNRG